jgi:hypothetical protein
MIKVRMILNIFTQESIKITTNFATYRSNSQRTFGNM